ncbi:nucleolar protein 14 [Macadamia integrifolia]|uniref:nucleolar protein 14 n=1 Tax=Macadamia integrifolia TaxID=60698 RepID=UPI001C4FF595|nr:nucleolar protein 14 [Macadamia integrifolia]
MAKTNTNNSNGNKKKKKSMTKKLLSAPNAKAMIAKPAKLNPFETIWTRRKFDILGKKRKGEEKRVGLARSRGIEKRKSTLLKEYEQSNKSSVFEDKRVGEQNDALGEFDKAILRFQRERQLNLKSKKNKFNLSDGEEDEYAMEAGGSFSARDDFDDKMLSDDDGDAAEIERKSSIMKQVNALNPHDPSETSSMDGEEKKHKSKKEVMEEIISKSKHYKAEKAVQKEEDERFMEQLDKDFTALLQSEVLSSLTQPSKMNVLKAGLNKSNSNEPMRKDELRATPSKESLKQEQPDSYDKLVREMVLDMRARPSDRTKSAEEIAQEERERLEHLEEERQKRMLVADDSGDEGSADHQGVDKLSDQKLRSISGDDLGDSFFNEEPGSKKGWVDEILGRKDAENLGSEESSEDSESGEYDSDLDNVSDENTHESRETLSLKGWEQSDDDNLSTDLEEEEEEEEEAEEGKQGLDGVVKVKDNTTIEVRNKKEDLLNTGRKKTSEEQHLARKKALPFVIEAPSTLAEFCFLVNSRSDAEIVEAINRIRACNAIRLAAENRKKMQVFYGVLLQYFCVLASEKPLNFKLLNLLVKPLMEMSVDTPYFAAICARQRLLRIRAQFCVDIKNPDKSCCPSLKTLFLLRLWSMIFPCSDFRHVVMTPVILLMCEYLMRCPVKSGRDIAVGSFLCSMVLSVAKQSRKFCPEAIIFLQTLLMSASDTKPGSYQHSQFYNLMELKTLKPWLRLQNRVSDIEALDFLSVMDLPEDSSFFGSDNFRASVLVSVIEMLRGFATVYEGFNSFPEIFLPISTLLHKVAKQENMPDTLQNNIRDVVQFIEIKAREYHMLRQPLQMRKQKLVPVKQLIPKFEENYVKGRDYDPDRERAEKKKLKKLLKREAKGAARELRKDNYFIYEVKQQDNALLEEERVEKYRKAKSFLEEQEHAFKSGQLGRGTKRRR